MEQQKVFAIFREHTGSQWDERVVSALIARVDGQPVAGNALKDVGRDVSGRVEARHDELCGCIDKSIELALATFVVAEPRNETVTV
jgi:hypothetical protein